jgi:hypothetical protein
MNRIARTLAALLVAASLVTAAQAQVGDSADSVVAGHQWCC